MKKYKITKNNITYDIYEDFNRNKYWYLNDKYHREGGPAIEYANGAKSWYKNGKLHRDDGPAFESVNGSTEYWYNGKYLHNIKSHKDLKRYVKLLSIS